MLIRLTKTQLDTIAPIAADGVIAVDRTTLASILENQLGSEPLAIAIMSVDYDQHSDGTPELNTRTVKGICWLPLGSNRCHKWSFRSDGLALSTTDEHEQPCPISDDTELISRAILAVADDYPESIISERTARIELSPPQGRVKQVRVLVIHDPRISRPEDVLAPLEFLAFKAGALGLAMVQPVEGGQALVRKFGL
jgi:hypothetical protein